MVETPESSGGCREELGEVDMPCWAGRKGQVSREIRAVSLDVAGIVREVDGLKYVADGVSAVTIDRALEALSGRQIDPDAEVVEIPKLSSEGCGTLNDCRDSRPDVDLGFRLTGLAHPPRGASVTGPLAAEEWFNRLPFGALPVNVSLRTGGMKGVLTQATGEVIEGDDLSCAECVSE